MLEKVRGGSSKLKLKIGYLKRSEVEKLSNLAKEIISRVPYYSKEAKIQEIKGFSAEHLRHKIGDKNNLYILAKENHKIVGFCYGYFEAGTFWLEWIGVDKEFRRKGIATYMIRFVANKLKRRGIHKVWNDSRVNNKEALGLFRKLGFKRLVSIKKHWYKQDFYLWQKLI